MSNMADFARDELNRAGLFDKDSDYGGMMGEAVMKMIEQFAEEGHSGSSAAMAIAIFEKLVRFEPLTPLTGEDDEWVDVSEYGYGSPCWQNKRCPHVFKDANGAYDIEGRIFRDSFGDCFTSGDIRQHTNILRHLLHRCSRVR